jgi:uncharacterized protein with GYD domain
MNCNLAFFVKGAPPCLRTCCSAISLTKVSGLSRIVPKRRAAARELGKKLGGDIKSGYLAIGTYDLIIHAESASDDAMAKFLLSLASKRNVRTTKLRCSVKRNLTRSSRRSRNPEGGRRNDLGEDGRDGRHCPC